MILLGVFPLTQSEVKRFCAIYFNGNNYDDDDVDDDDDETDHNVHCYVIIFPHR